MSAYLQGMGVQLSSGTANTGDQASVVNTTSKDHEDHQAVGSESQTEKGGSRGLAEEHTGY